MPHATMLMLMLILLVQLSNATTLRAERDILLIRNKRLHFENLNLLLQLETSSLLATKQSTSSIQSNQANTFPKILCEEFMHGSLTECRNAHVQCVTRAYGTTEERKTMRSIRRSALDPTALKDQRERDEKNLQPQQMTPLQRKMNFAKAFDIPLGPFSDLSLGAKIKGGRR